MKKAFGLCILIFFVLSIRIHSDLPKNNNIIIITHPDVSVSFLDKKTIKDIFTGVKKRWDSEEKIILAVLEDSELHKQFLKNYIDKTSYQFRNYWREKVFTGEGELPKYFKTEESLIEFVATTKGAVGYVSTPPEKLVKVIKISETY